MDKPNQACKSNVGLLRIVFGGLLLGLPVIPFAVTTAQTNPCPRIYYEEPFNSTRPAPQGCPANAASQQRGGTQSTPVAAPYPNPLPEQQTPPSANVELSNGSVTIKMVNETGTTINYEVIGTTEQRSLAGRTDTTLQNLSAPINITLVRPDGGFVLVTPRTSSPGQLELLLREAQTPDQGTGAISIQRDGNVFLN